MNILLVGHACCPGLGSEQSITWNWAWYLSKKHKVWALTHPQHRPQIESYLKQNPNENLQFVWAELPSWMDPWDPRGGDAGWGMYRLQVHYLMWQRVVYRMAKQLHREHGFDICHYVSWGTVSLAPSLWKLPVPFFWGPLGGAQMAPLAFRKYLGKGWKNEALRALRVRLRGVARSLKQAAEHSALILATNNETEAVLAAAGAKTVRLFLDSGLPEELLAAEVPVSKSSPGLLLHWCGRLEAHKALPLALEALAQVKDLDVRLEISGEGTEWDHCKALTEQLDLSDRVTFLGHVKRAQVLERFRAADAFLWTSLRDSFGTVLLEAMGQGLPIIALDHQGAHTFVPAEAGWKIPVTEPAETVEALAQAIRRVAADPEDRARRAGAALRFAQSQTWSERVTRMEVLYERYRHKGKEPVADGAECGSVL